MKYTGVEALDSLLDITGIDLC